MNKFLFSSLLFDAVDRLGRLFLKKGCFTKHFGVSAFFSLPFFGKNIISFFSLVLVVATSTLIGDCLYFSQKCWYLSYCFFRHFLFWKKYNFLLSLVSNCCRLLLWLEIALDFFSWSVDCFHIFSSLFFKRQTMQRDEMYGKHCLRCWLVWEKLGGYIFFKE